LLFLVASLAIVTRPVPSPLPAFSRVDLGDHVSHVGTTLLFLHSGFEVFSREKASFCDRPLTRDEAIEVYRRIGFPAFIPEDYCAVRAGPERAFHVNWPHLVSPYPIGLYLYTLPEALLFSSGVAEHSLATFSLLKFSVVAVLLCLALYRVYVPVGAVRARGAGALLWAVSTFLVFFWAVHGIYDGIAVLCMVLSIQRAPKSSLEGLLLAILATALHYRMLLFLPFIVWLFVRAAQRFRAQTAAWQALFLAGSALAVLNGFIFHLQWPALSRLPMTNTLRTAAGALLFLLITGAFVAYAWRTRHMLLAISVLWVSLCLVAVRQVMPWHFLALLPLLPLSRLEPKSDGPFIAAHAYLAVTLVAIQLGSGLGP
jgi:hypothetical protein